MERYSIYVTDELWSLLKVVANNKGLGRQSYIRQILMEAAEKDNVANRYDAMQLGMKLDV